MSRSSLLTLALGLAAASVCAAGISVRTEFFKIRVILAKKKYASHAVRMTNKWRLEVINIDRGWWSEGERSGGPEPDRWRVLGTKIKASVYGGYLAYDPSGKDPRVFLAQDPGEGTDWKIGNRKVGENDIQQGVVQALSGKVRGWCLDVEEYEEKGKDSKPTTAYRLVLRKDVVRTKVHVSRVYRYEATAR